MVNLSSWFKKRIWTTNVDNESREEMYHEIIASLGKVNSSLTNIINDCRFMQEESLAIEEEQVLIVVEKKEQQRKAGLKSE